MLRRSTQMLIVIFSCLVAYPVQVSGQIARPATTSPLPRTEEQRTRDVVHSLGDIQIPMTALQKPILFTQALKEVENALPKAKKFAIRLEKDASLKFPQLESARIEFPPFPKKMTLRNALRLLLGKLDVSLAYRIGPDEIVVTTRERANSSLSYDVGDVVSKWPSVRRHFTDRFMGESAPASAATIVQLIFTTVNPKSWHDSPQCGKVTILNGTRLAVSTTAENHLEISDLLAAIRRLADLTVVLNARLYMLEKGFYARHIQSLLGDPEGRRGLRKAVPISPELEARVKTQELAVKGNGVKIDNNGQAAFLSLQHALANAAPPRDFRRAPTAVLEGVSFTARVAVSADRRRVRLTISQTTSEVLETKIFLGFDPATRKVLPVVVPDVRQTITVESLDADDGACFLLPVVYSPPEGPNDRKWVLLIRPVIYIEEEQKALREEKARGAKPEQPAADQIPEHKPKPLPRSLQIEQILHAIIKDVLTNRELKSTREFYGTPGDKHYVLEGGFVWPKWFRPAVPGFERINRTEVELDHESPHVMGIRIDQFDLKGKKHGPFEAPIAICISNAGGNANGAVIGGCTVYYTPRRHGKGWSVEYEGLVDP